MFTPEAPLSQRPLVGPASGSGFARYEPDEKILADALGPDELVVRPATVADLSGILETDEQAHRVSAGLLPLAEAIADESRLVVVACVEGCIVGWGKTHFYPEPHGLAPGGHYLGGGTVKPDWRRRGIAAALTAARLHWVWARATAAYYMVNAANLASIDLHERWGFQLVATAPSFHTTEFMGGVGLLMSADRPRKRDDVTEVEFFGGVERRKLELRTYDAYWPIRFEAERQKIQSVLGEHAVSIEHIGSTAVPGLAAKDIVDILIFVSDITDEEHYVNQLVSVGYELRVREPGHRLLRTPALDVHLHVQEPGNDHAAEQLRFRDQLRHSDDDRKLYESTKRNLLQRNWVDMNAYADAKTDVIREILSHCQPRTGGIV